MNRQNSPAWIAAGLLLCMLVGCATQQTPTNSKLDQETAVAIDLFKRTDPDMQKFFNTAVGYAVFPSVTKAGAGIGMAHGEGQVFAGGKLIGTATLTQFTVGLQLGAQEYAEIIFFENKAVLDQFCSNQFAFSAQASAVAASAGASADANYQKGVVVFTIAKGGLMFEASIGGQKFRFTPLRKVPLY
ncbi:MAG: YSC84-related protein [Verrucomicrobiae bacterium]|nr:YSC84-related protein [Verrucomicrobiae bacterium]